MCNSATLVQSILTGDAKASETLARQWPAAGRSTREFYDTVLAPAIAALRERFARRDFYLPELLIALRAARKAIDVVHGAAGGETQSLRDTVVLGSLAWDGHGLCRSVVRSLLQVSGWRVSDVGANVPPARFADACTETHASVLVVADMAIASGPVPPMASSREISSLVEELDARGIRKQTKVLLVSLAPDSSLKGPHRVDMICDDLTEVPPSVRRLAAGDCLEP
jgi:methanogenic corrinoid protein MtbC1